MADSFQSRLDQVRDRITAACLRCCRSIEEVQLLTVSKTFGPQDVAEAVECGLKVFGESRIQEAKQKIPLCSGNLDWHMIGHLQRNKVKDAVQLFKMIHGVDSARLLETINMQKLAAGGTMPVCLEVNVSGEGSKFGMNPEEVPAVLEGATKLMNVDVVGLMTIPPFTPDPEGSRPYFKALRDLRDKCRKESGFPLEQLSMGMSHDFEVAIEEGATWIRLGSILFGERKKKETDSLSTSSWDEA
ncbi:MAG: YggS family pyridoxal phosphate enzyme [Lentisphaerae bacterium RIFOXYA12_FULL_48_11]|nr:MAG: YggS family pyridoxal phosphate enzyme [Lentisphaerae bacterium RIFOXYA12_FULL_48_11]